jgi:hypothetical protein
VEGAMTANFLRYPRESVMILYLPRHSGARRRREPGIQTYFWNVLPDSGSPLRGVGMTVETFILISPE